MALSSLHVNLGASNHVFVNATAWLHCQREPAAFSPCVHANGTAYGMVWTVMSLMPYMWLGHSGHFTKFFSLREFFGWVVISYELDVIKENHHMHLLVLKDLLEQKLYAQRACVLA